MLHAANMLLWMRFTLSGGRESKALRFDKDQ